jgi:two-component system, OmpR family, heavy metal sensor histidine kinase CusS
MKSWPLRWKIALYAASLGVVATFAGAATTWLLMRRSEIRTFDQRLTVDGNELIRDIENFGSGWSTNQTAIKEIFVPLALRNRLIEIRGKDNEVLYRSESIHQPITDDGIAEVHGRVVEGRRVRMGTFRKDDLTAFVGADLSEINELGRDILFGMLGAIPTVLIVVALGGSWVASRALGPVEAIRQAAARITPRHLDQRLPVPQSKGEIAGLVKVLNDTFERLQRSFEQSIRFSADASHHLKTPLAVLRGGVEELLTDPASSEKQQALANTLLDQVRHLTSVSENLLLLARADAGRLDLKREKFDFREVLDGALDDMATLAKPENISIETEIDGNVIVTADKFAVSLIVQNLIDNAIKYNHREGAIRLQLHALNGQIELRIANKAEPIPEERIAHIFERFYRVGANHRIGGQGLGLSIARELARAHGGDLTLLQSDAEWTEFRLTLPRE